MMTNRQRIIQTFVDRGFKEDTVSRSVRELFSFHEKIGLLYRYVYKGRVVQSVGSLNPEIMVVSDKPEEAERIFGFSGYGMYSVYLMTFFQRLGLSVEDIFWTNVIKEPVEKVNLSLIKKWGEHLYNEIYLTQPAAIVALGTTAITALAKEPIKIEKAVGGDFFFEAGAKDIPVIPIKHPRSILEEDDEAFKQDTRGSWQNLKIIGDLL